MAEYQRLLEDLAAPTFSHGVEQGFWELVEFSGWIAHVGLHAPDGRSYMAELTCTGYGDEPILGRFVDPTTRQCVASAWPTGNGTFNGWVKFSGNDLFICWDQDREGIQRHQEWKGRRAWTRNPNQIVGYLDFLRGLLHIPARGYQRQIPSAA